MSFKEVTVKLKYNADSIKVINELEMIDNPDRLSGLTKQILGDAGMDEGTIIFKCTAANIVGFKLLKNRSLSTILKNHFASIVKDLYLSNSENMFICVKTKDFNDAEVIRYKQLSDAINDSNHIFGIHMLDFLVTDGNNYLSMVEDIDKKSYSYSEDGSYINEIDTDEMRIVQDVNPNVSLSTVRTFDHSVSSSESVRILAQEIGSSPTEKFAVLNFDENLNPINYSISSIGNISSTMVCSHNLFQNSFLSNAKACLYLHNHPSGNLKPSKEDIINMKRLEILCKSFNIRYLGNGIANYKDELNIFDLSVADENEKIKLFGKSIDVGKVFKITPEFYKNLVQIDVDIVKKDHTFKLESTDKFNQYQLAYHIKYDEKDVASGTTHTDWVVDMDIDEARKAITENLRSLLSKPDRNHYGSLMSECIENCKASSSGVFFIENYKLSEYSDAEVNEFIKNGNDLGLVQNGSININSHYDDEDYFAVCYSLGDQFNEIYDDSLKQLIIDNIQDNQLAEKSVAQHVDLEMSM